uniref:Uncharacterized protein n=1 Tax=Parascaris univalens TaxID=6257 RepID=A0A914ZU12_PARUN
NRHSVSDTVARVEHYSSGTTRSVEGKHRLDGNVHGRRVEGLEHDLGHFSLFAFGLRGASVSSTGCSSGATRNSL